MYLNDTGSTVEQFRHHKSSQHAQENESLPHKRPFQLPYLASGVTPSVTHKRPCLYDNSHNAEVPFLKFTSASSNTPNLEISALASQKAHQSPFAPVRWPQPHKSQPLHLLPTPNLQVDNKMPIGIQQQNLYVPLPQQQFDADGRKLLRQAFPVHNQLPE